MMTAVVDSPLRLSIIIPTLNEAESILTTLNRLQILRKRGHEVIVSDGGSKDNTIELCLPLVDRVIKSETGRARQMNAGAKLSRGDVLWFLHADTLISANADEIIQSGLTSSTEQWGRFDVKLTGKDIVFRMIETLMNLRSRISGIATGDQGIFIKREIFEQVAGYADIPLMEDIEISQRLKKISAPLCLKEKIITSSRRWETKGIWRTIFLMWRLRFAYLLGAKPSDLAQRYR